MRTRKTNRDHVRRAAAAARGPTDHVSRGPTREKPGPPDGTPARHPDRRILARAILAREAQQQARSRGGELSAATRSARWSGLRAWLFGVFSLFAVISAIAPQTPDDVPIGLALAAGSALAAALSAAQARRHRRYRDDLVRPLSRSLQSAAGEQFSGELEYPGCQAAYRQFENDSAAANSLIPLIVGASPDLALSVHSASTAIHHLAERVLALEAAGVASENETSVRYSGRDRIFRPNRVVQDYRRSAEALLDGMRAMSELLTACARIAAVQSDTAHADSQYVGSADRIRELQRQTESLTALRAGFEAVRAINQAYLPDTDRLEI